MPWRKAALARRLAALTGAAALRASHREGLRLRVASCNALRKAFAEAGIDPARISCLYLCDEAAAELASLGNTPAFQRADAAFSAAVGNPAPTESWTAKLAPLLPRFADGHRPDPTASLIDWVAWTLARRQPGRLHPQGSSPPRFPV
jgi:hypothetical protein